MHDAWMQMKESLAKIRELAASNPPIFIIRHQKRTGAEQDRLLSQADVAESYDAMHQMTAAQIISTPNGPLVVPASAYPGWTKTSGPAMWKFHKAGGDYDIRVLADFPNGSAHFSLSYFPTTRDWCELGQRLVRVNDHQVLSLDETTFEQLIKVYSTLDIGNPTVVYTIQAGMVTRFIPFPTPQPAPSYPRGFTTTPKVCECGAAKAFNAKPGDTAHSSWCPVAAHK